MKVVDTSVWSRVWRRPPLGTPHPAAVRVAEWVRDGTTLLVPGVVLQELLSGLRRAEDVERLGALMAPYPLLLATREHHLAAARIVNHARGAGVQVGAIDALLAASAEVAGAELVTYDRDFEHLARVYPLRVSVWAD